MCEANLTIADPPTSSSCSSSSSSYDDDIQHETEEHIHALPTLVDGTVTTPFGDGQLISVRPGEPTLYKIQLEWGALLSTPTLPEQQEETNATMALNEAYEAYETMRLLNLQVELATHNVSFTPNDIETVCVTCLRQRYQQPEQRRRRRRRRHTEPCLFCASLVCPSHASRRPDGITVCTSCEEVLEQQPILLTNKDDLSDYTRRLVDLYDRGLLLLQYISKFTLPVAAQLEQRETRHHQWGAGSSSMGLVSGVLGVAAACTLWTPAGPPLLIASLVFGGTSTAVQTGSEVRQHYSAPNQMADRMLAIHDMVQSVVQVLEHMRMSTLVPWMEQTARGSTPPPNTSTALVASTAATSVAARWLVAESVGASRFLSRAGTAAARGVQLAQVAGGALSAVTIVWEARELTKTVTALREGNCAKKAERLRSVLRALDTLPTTDHVHQLCQLYGKVMEQEQLKQQQALEHEANQVLLQEVLAVLEAGLEGDRRVIREKLPLLERIHQFKQQQQQEAAKVDCVV